MSVVSCQLSVVSCQRGEIRLCAPRRLLTGRDSQRSGSAQLFEGQGRWVMRAGNDVANATKFPQWFRARLASRDDTRISEDSRCWRTNSRDREYRPNREQSAKWPRKTTGICHKRPRMERPTPATRTAEGRREGAAPHGPPARSAHRRPAHRLCGDHEPATRASWINLTRPWHQQIAIHE